MTTQFSRKALTGAIKQVLADDDNLKDYIKAYLTSQNPNQNQMTNYNSLALKITKLINDLEAHYKKTRLIKNELESEIAKARYTYNKINQNYPKY